MRGPSRRKVSIERKLRGSQTDAERKLWFALRDRRLAGFKFVRQEAIGPLVVDFVCRERRLIVEVDGGQHAESANDLARDAYLERENYRVVRFWNNDVLTNREGVLSTILDSLNGVEHLPLTRLDAPRLATLSPLRRAREKKPRRVRK